jgi:hypothetical protein
VNRGTQVNTVITVKNVGTTTISLSGQELSGTNSADFIVSGGNTPCASSLAPGISCTFTVYWDPTKTGTETATYKLYDNSPGSPQTIKLTGTGN